MHALAACLLRTLAVSAAVAVVLIQVSRCKEIYFEQTGRLGSLERATTLSVRGELIMPYKLENKALNKKSLRL